MEREPAAARGSEEAVEELLSAFLAGVRQHLGSPAAMAAGAGGAAGEAARVVHLALEPGGEAGAVAALLANPALMASFFQNADLLDTSDPAGARIAAVVMHALQEAMEREQP